MAFDEFLLFDAHVEKLKVAVRKRLDLLHALAGRDWGCEWACLRRLYVAYVQSKVEYALGAYGLRAANLARLHPLHMDGARHIVGHARGTRCVLSLREAELLPLHLRAVQAAVVQRERLLRLPPDVPARQSDTVAAPQ